MIACGNKAQRRFASKIISVFIALSFLFTSIAPSYAQGLSAGLSAPSTLLAPTASFYPVLLRAIEIDPGNPFHFGFIVDSGDTAMEGEALTEEAKKLIRYFLASLTTPEQDMWVNLSPYEKDRIIPEGFGQTQMGRDLLSQDYILKQLTASLIYPEDELGKKFWEKVYKAAYEKYGTTDIPIDTFNKIWILPKKASIYEHSNRVFVVDSELAVMMEEDYLALQESQNSKVKNQNETPQPNKLNKPNNALASSVIREIVIPAIEKEVNFGKHFASLRQVYHAMILATWYKNNLKESLLGKIYMDQNKIKGIDLVDSSEKQKIYEDYLNTFQKGIYDFIKVERDQHTGKNIPRKYFSGGFTPTTPDGTPLRQALKKVTPSADKLQTKGSATRFDANLTESEDDGRSSASAIQGKDITAKTAVDLYGQLITEYPGQALWGVIVDTKGNMFDETGDRFLKTIQGFSDQDIQRVKIIHDITNNNYVEAIRSLKDPNTWKVQIGWGLNSLPSGKEEYFRTTSPRAMITELTNRLKGRGELNLDNMKINYGNSQQPYQVEFSYSKAYRLGSQDLLLSGLQRFKETAQKTIFYQDVPGSPRKFIVTREEKDHWSVKQIIEGKTFDLEDIVGTGKDLYWAVKKNQGDYFDYQMEIFHKNGALYIGTHPHSDIEDAILKDAEKNGPCQDISINYESQYGTIETKQAIREPGDPYTWKIINKAAEELKKVSAGGQSASAIINVPGADAGWSALDEVIRRHGRDYFYVKASYDNGGYSNRYRSEVEGDFLTDDQRRKVVGIEVGYDEQGRKKVKFDRQPDSDAWIMKVELGNEGFSPTTSASAIISRVSSLEPASVLLREIASKLESTGKMLLSFNILTEEGYSYGFSLSDPQASGRLSVVLPKAKKVTMFFKDRTSLAFAKDAANSRWKITQFYGQGFNFKDEGAKWSELAGSINVPKLRAHVDSKEMATGIVAENIALRLTSEDIKQVEWYRPSGKSLMAEKLASMPQDAREPLTVKMFVRDGYVVLHRAKKANFWEFVSQEMPLVVGEEESIISTPSQPVSSALISIPATTGREAAAVLIKDHQVDPYFISGTDQSGNIKPFITAVWHAEAPKLSESEKKYYGLDFRDYFYGWSETELPISIHAFNQSERLLLRLSEDGKTYRSSGKGSKGQSMSSSLVAVERPAGTMNAYDIVMALKENIHHKTWSVEWNDSSYLEHEAGFAEFFKEQDLGSGQRLTVKFWQENRDSPLTQIMIDQYDLFASITALRFSWNDEKQNFDAVLDENIARKAQEIIKRMPASVASSGAIARQQLISPITRIMQDERSDVSAMGVKLRSGGYQRVSVSNPKAPWQDLDLREPIASIRIELGNGSSYYLNVRYEGKRAIIDVNKVRTTFSQTETVAARMAPMLMDKRNFRLGSSRDRESYLRVLSESKERNWQAVDQISNNFSKERAVQKIKDLSAREKAVFVDIEQHSILEKDKIEQWLSKPGKPLAYQIRFQDGSYIYLVSKDLSYRDPVVSVTSKTAEVKSVVSAKRGYWTSDSAKIQRDVEEIISIIGREEKMETIKIFSPAMLYDANKLKLKDAIDRFKEKFSMLVTQKLEGIVLTFRTYSIEISVSKSTQQIIHVHVKDKQGMRLPGFDRSKLSSENVFSTASATTYIDGAPYGEPAQRTLGLERYLEEKPNVPEVKKAAPEKRGFLPSDSAKIQRDVEELLSVIDQRGKLQTIIIRSFDENYRGYDASAGAQIKDAVDAFRERFGDVIKVINFRTNNFNITVELEKRTGKVLEVLVFDKTFPANEKADLQRYRLSAENFLSTAPEGKKAEVQSKTPEPSQEIPYDADIVSRKEKVSFKGVEFDVQEFSKRILDATKGKLLIDTGLDFDWRKNVIFSFSSQNKMDYRAMHKPAKNVSYMVVLRQVEDEMIEIEAEFQNSAGEMNHDEGLLRLATDILRSMSQEPGVVDAPQATEPAMIKDLTAEQFKQQLAEFIKQLGVQNEIRIINVFDGHNFFGIKVNNDYENIERALKGLQDYNLPQSIEFLVGMIRVVIDIEGGKVVNVRDGMPKIPSNVKQKDIDRVRQNLPLGHFLSTAKGPAAESLPAQKKAEDTWPKDHQKFQDDVAELVEELGAGVPTNLLLHSSFIYERQWSFSRVEEIATTLGFLDSYSTWGFPKLEIFFVEDKLIIEFNEDRKIKEVRFEDRDGISDPEFLGNVRAQLPKENFLSTASSGVKVVLPENFSIEELANTLQKEISADRVSFNYIDTDGGSSGNLSAMDAQRLTFKNPKTRQISLQFHYNDRVWGDVLRFKLENGSVVVDAYQAMDLGDELNIPDQKFLAQAFSVLKAMDAVTTSLGLSEKSASPFAFDGVPSTVIKSLPMASILDAVKAVEGVMGKKAESFLWNGLDYEIEEDSHIFHRKLVETDSVMPNSLLFTFDTQEEKEMNVVILTDADKGVSIAVRKTDRGQGDKGFLVRNRGERQEDVEIKIKEKLEAVSSGLTREDFFAVIDHMVDLAREEGYELVKLVPDKNEKAIDEYADLDLFKDELTQITDEDNINKDVNGVLLVFYNSKQDDHEQAHILFYQNISGLITVRVSHPNSIRKEFRIAGLNQHRSITNLDFLLKTITASVSSSIGVKWNVYRLQSRDLERRLKGIEALRKYNDPRAVEAVKVFDDLMSRIPESTSKEQPYKKEMKAAEFLPEATKLKKAGFDFEIRYQREVGKIGRVQKTDIWSYATSNGDSPDSSDKDIISYAEVGSYTSGDPNYIITDYAVTYWTDGWIVDTPEKIEIISLKETIINLIEKQIKPEHLDEMRSLIRLDDVQQAIKYRNKGFDFHVRYNPFYVEEGKVWDVSYMSYIDGDISNPAILSIHQGDRLEPVNKNQAKSTSSASSNLGGIDMSSSNLDLQIRRDGNGIPLPISQQPIELLNIQGFTFEIMGITPVASLLLLSGLDTKTPSNKAKGADTPELIGRPAEPALSVEEYAQVGLL